MPLRIAVVGSGIAGHGAALRLSRHFGAHTVAVFEKENRPGGHSATVDIVHSGREIAVDTGFIVYNELNYPRLTRLFAELDVATKPSDMGFSLSLDGGRYEWAGLEQAPVRGFFAQKRNLVSPRHWRMLADIIQFSEAAQRDLAAGHQDGVPLEALSLGDYVARGGWSAMLRDDYILPMGGAIWSMAVEEVADFPALSFLNFFNNHRLLSRNRPQWRTVEGGSRAYVDKLIRASGHTTRYGNAVTGLRRVPGGVEVLQANGERQLFHKVVLACHSDEALALIEAPSPEEQAALTAIRYAPNTVWLHRDPALMPRRKSAWAAWNVLRQAGDGDRPVTVSYWMNALQAIDPDFPVFITLNPPQEPREDLVFGRYSYAHPQYDAAAVAAQKAFPALQGHGGLYFAGAWLGYGFHEDGLRSGEEAADRLIADWTGETARLAGHAVSGA
jgi:predicted NAD/FAD-binding protein